MSDIFWSNTSDPVVQKSEKLEHITVFDEVIVMLLIDLWKKMSMNKHNKSHLYG